ncbi:hypothetical protein C8J56DRAFT_1162618 [Mycena floridula]|nr:hypothetical protein C8J56DRAFT_1162618 [Mycena floridula]
MLQVTATWHIRTTHILRYVFSFALTGIILQSFTEQFSILPNDFAARPKWCLYWVYCTCKKTCCTGYDII